MKPSFLAVVRASLVKDLLLARRYVPDLIGRLLDLTIRVLFFLLLSQTVAVDARQSPLGVAMSGVDLLVFFLGALVLLVFNTTALHTPVHAVERDLTNGTLEYLFCNPSSRYAYFLGTVLASAAINLVIVLPLFGVLVSYAQPDLPRVLAMLLVCALVLLTSVAMGVLLSLLGLLWRQVGALTAVLAILFEMLAGAYVPVTALPAALRYAALLLPQTWGFDLIRAYSFGARWTTLYPLWLGWLVLTAYAVVFTSASVALLRLAEKRAKRTGFHLI